MDIFKNFELLSEQQLVRLVIVAIFIILTMIIVKVARSALSKSSQALESRQRIVSATTLRALASSIPILALAVIFPILTSFLKPPANILPILDGAGAVLISLALGFALYRLVDSVSVWLSARVHKADNKMDDMLIPIVRTGLRVTIILLTILQIAQSLTDRPLTSIIAGLGVGGLAVALAAQDTIKHFFGSLVLFADKPFQIGERITVDNIDGIVEEVGFRSTRIRTLEGHLVTLANGDLANKVIVNITKRPNIRHRSIINIVYSTTPEKVQLALKILRDLLKDHEGQVAELPAKVFFDEFSASSLNILIMYWYHPADFWAYKAYHERLSMKLLEEFKNAGIEFAFPTQTIHLIGQEENKALNAK